MSVHIFKSIKQAIGNLNPEEIHRHMDLPVRLFLYADTEDEYRHMEDFFMPGELSEAKRARVSQMVDRASEVLSPSAPNDLAIYFQPAGWEWDVKDAFAFYAEEPEHTVREVLRSRPDLAIPLALHFLPFRREVSRRIVKKVAKENALFALATAVPDIAPFISLPWAIGEFASDTAVLTANQIRMAFLLAAASDRDVGYSEQKAEIASIVLGAFGWRALARELIGKIPLGGGLVPKAAIAYAGTRVVGLSLQRLYEFGYGYTRQERRVAYEDALEQGKRVVSAILTAFQQWREAET